jgi:hypothetical protein
MKNIVIKIVVTMPRCKTKRQTTYHQCYNALSALEVHNIGKVHHKASSEEAFILTVTKTATGHSNVALADLFGFSGDGMVSLIYQFLIGVLDNKARGLLHDGVGCLRRWVPLFPDFAEIIKKN